MSLAVFDRLAALSDPIRCRLLLALEGRELAVNELRAVLQLPQSTVSRHLKVLADEGWVTSRESGTTNWYRMSSRELDPSARRLWQVVREECADTPAASRDAERVKNVLAARHTRSQEFFATTAGHWDRLRDEMFGAGSEWFALGGLVDPTWDVGDLGAGTGHLAAALAPLARSVVAVDESPAMLRAARARLAGASNVEFKQGTLEALPLEPASLDLALLILVLHYLPDPGKALEEAARTLRPGGRLVIVDMMPHEKAEFRETMGHQWLGFDAETMTGWFNKAGLYGATYRRLAPRPNAKGPLLFVAAVTKPN